MTMNDNTPVFIDTNVLLRFDIQETPEHIQIRQAMKTLIDRNCALWISRQVVREYCRALTHPAFNKPLEMKQAVARARQLMPFFNIADENELVTNNLLTLLETVAIAGKQVHDANIVASMQAVKVSQLFTLNIADFKRFEPAITLLTLEQLTGDSDA